MESAIAESLKNQLSEFKLALGEVWARRRKFRIIVNLPFIRNTMYGTALTQLVQQELQGIKSTKRLPTVG